MKIIRQALLFISLSLLLSCSNTGKIEDLSGDMFKGLTFRPIGPGTYAGRISDILVHPGNDSIIYVSASTGGIFKSINKGESWIPVFDRAGKSLAIGDMDISPGNQDLIWAGTGEASGEQNPASIGDGIYKSIDGGISWNNMGLSETRHFSKVIIHPDNDNIVFAGATGSRWGSDTNRGVFRTIDGGQSWEKVLYINDNTGISDLLIHPDGETVFASAWEQRRNAWAHVRQAPNSGLYKSQDGGSSWEKITTGLPDDKAGRIALAFADSNPDIIYACYEHDSLGLFRSDDKGKSWVNVNNRVGTSYWYGRIYVDPTDPDHIFIMGVYIQESFDGGKNFKPVNTGRGVHVDHHVLWIDPENTDQKYLGNDGGFYITEDGGESWQFIANLPIGQYYDISVDNRNPYWIYGGLQDNGVWGGPSRSESGKPVSNKDIVSISGGDGFYSDSEPDDPAVVYGESQYGNIVRVNLDEQSRKRIRPRPGEEAGQYRFNWNTPFFISNHKPHALYIGAQKVLKSEDRGENWTEISDDLSGYFDLDSILVIGQKPVLKPYFTITALAESPLRKGLIYAGTDDGKLYITTDDGETWKDLSKNIPAPSDRFFSRIVVSKHNEGRVYIGFGRFYEANDLKPYIFMSDDYGASWSDISNNLPFPSVIRSIAEHPSNPDILFTGTHNSLYISLNRGLSWVRPETKLPYVAIDDIVIQERENDLVLGTYGRGIWILDNISFLSDMSTQKLQEKQILFEPEISVSNISNDTVIATEKYQYVAPEDPNGIVITYYLGRTYKKGSRKYPVITITGPEDKEQELKDIPASSGFNRILWPPEMPGEYEIILITGKQSSSKTFGYY